MEVIPNLNDVLFGRGTPVNSHPGNKYFRSIVEEKRALFGEKLNRKEKRLLVEKIVTRITERGGRFLVEVKDDASTGKSEVNNNGSQLHPTILARRWAVVDKEQVILKVLHRLREKRELSEQAEHNHGNESIPVLPHYPSTISPPMMNMHMQCEHQRSMGGYEQFSYCGASVGSATTTAAAAATINRYGLVGANETRGNSQLKVSNEFEQMSTTPNEGGRLLQTRHVPDHSAALIRRHSSPALGTNQLSDNGHIFDAEEYDWTPNLLTSSLALGATQLGDTDGHIFDAEEYDWIPNLKTSDLNVHLDSFLRDFDSHNDAHTIADVHQGTMLQTNDLDVQLDLFLRDFSIHNDAHVVTNVHQETLRQWIERSKTKITQNSLDRVKLGLPVALQFIDYLVEADQCGQNCEVNPVPLASISTSNAMVESKEFKVESVSILNCNGDDPVVGGAMERLVALGLVLYELFSGEIPTFIIDAPAKMLSMSSISLNNVGDSTQSNSRPRRSAQGSQDVPSECFARLRCLGIPQSISSLVQNLLQCNQGDLRSDDAYSSLADVQSDLRLMLQDPQRFLYDIPVYPLPSLIIPHNKLYGREAELEKIDGLYQEHINGSIGGILISGNAGVGKSKIAMHFQGFEGYFFLAKFDQNYDVYPLARVGSLLNSLCDRFAGDATDTQLTLVQKELDIAFGIHAGILDVILPSLRKIMPSCSSLGYTWSVDSVMRIQFLFGELLRVISSHSRHISFFLDDLQWADPLSLSLIGSLISCNEVGKRVFFICTYRDEETQRNQQFSQWLSSTPSLSFQAIKLENICVNGINNLVSDMLHLSPRITRPLSSVLYHRTGRGNPLFLTTTIDSLRDNGCIYFDMSCPKWAWDMESIMELEMADDVVALLVEEMKKLNTDLQQGLIIASCMGSSVNSLILNILSNEIGMNLQDITHQVSLKGYMINVGDSVFRFSHDKIQQAAYELMPERHKRENHVRLGVALCSHALSASENDELLFASVNQINKGGSDILANPEQRLMIAALNLKVGKKSMDLSDLNTAINLFKHGISFLNTDHWRTNYKLSINLLDAAADAASLLGDMAAVTTYTTQLLANARISDDKLNCMFSIISGMLHQGKHTHDHLQKVVESSFSILELLDEPRLRCLEDIDLIADIESTNAILLNTADESILNMDETTDHKFTITMKVLSVLGQTFNMVQEQYFAASCLRMVELTLRHGLCLYSPVAYARYGQVLVSMGHNELGIRLGIFALTLVDKKGYNSLKSNVYSVVYPSILFLSTPFQSNADAHAIGHRVGQQSGDNRCAFLNMWMVHTTSYIAGKCLNDCRTNFRKAAMEGMRRKVSFFHHICLFHVQVCALIEGLHLVDAENIDDLPGEQKTAALTKGVFTGGHVHWIVRTFLFRQFEGISVDTKLISDMKDPLKIIIMFGLLFEGLLSFELARRAKDQDALIWMAKGESVLEKMKCWNKNCSWNFENKMLLLEAERSSIMGDFDQAESSYIRSVRSARDHKFVHEEAIASELAGIFFLDRGRHPKSYLFSMHSVECYKKWGALAVARRVEDTIRHNFGTDPFFVELPAIVDSLTSVLSFEQLSSRKRQTEGK